jgi:septal ring factor EnvC (AmiA/AmiB activator)
VHRQQLRATQQELESATIALADEQARLAALRAELGALEREKGAEVDARLRSVQELSTALAVSCCWQQRLACAQHCLRLDVATAGASMRSACWGSLR